MSREKQIEEMIEVIRQDTESCKTCSWYAEGLCLDNCELNEDNHAICETLYKAGYRKQIEGEWVWTENGEADCEKYWVCSACKEHDFVKTKYCPNCGAKMKGGE